MIALAGAVVAATALAGIAIADEPDSGEVSTMVVGGAPASTADHPWAVAFHKWGKPSCGGTLVAPTKVVTAAHCVITPANGNKPVPVEDMLVIAGRDDMRIPNGVEAKVIDAWTHPKFVAAIFHGPSMVNDIAVLTLDRTLTQPTAPFATNSNLDLYAPGTDAQVLGWGRTEENGPVSPVLQKATVPVIADTACKATYGNGVELKTSFCAGFPQGGVDACTNDSGGPLVVNGKLIGIVSWGVGCAQPGKYGVYTRVSEYTAELQEQLAS